MSATFRCRSCGFELPAVYEGERRFSLCYLCDELTEEERKVMEREYAAYRRKVRLRLMERLAKREEVS